MMATEMEILDESSNPTQPRAILIEKPKRALTAYNLYFQALRQEMLKEQRVSGKKIGFAAMARTVASMWKVLDRSEKVHYELLAQQDKVRYAHEISLWKNAKKTAASVKTIHDIGEKDTQTLPAGHSPAFVRNQMVNVRTRCDEGPQRPASYYARAQPDHEVQRIQQVPRALSIDDILMVHKDSNLTAALRSKCHHVLTPPFSSACSTQCLSSIDDANVAPHTQENQISPIELSEATQLRHQAEEEGRFSCIPNGLDFFYTHNEDPNVSLSSDQGQEDRSEKNVPSSDTAMFDLAQMANEHGPPSAEMGVLADRMGSECADLFLDIFRS